jgi:hypothetical protein
MTDERTRLLAEKARIEAELAKLDAEPDWEAWRPALEAFGKVFWGSPTTRMIQDDTKRSAIRGLIAAAPLMPRDAGMADAEIAELARDCSSEDWRSPYDAARNAIRETLKRAPQVRWPGEAELREMGAAVGKLWGVSPEWEMHCAAAALEMARRLKAHLTGEGK